MTREDTASRRDGGGAGCPDTNRNGGVIRDDGNKDRSNFEIENGVLKKYHGGKSGKVDVTIPDGVTAVGDGAFFECAALAGVTIPGGVTVIGNAAFACCAALSGVSGGAGVTAIGGYAFYRCAALRAVTVPGGVASIGEFAFYDCAALASVTFGGDRAALASGVFDGDYAAMPDGGKARAGTYTRKGSDYDNYTWARYE